MIEYHDEHEADVGPANTGPGATMATVTVDPAAPIRWSLLLTRVCFTVRYNKARLISIFADVKADAQVHQQSPTSMFATKASWVRCNRSSPTSSRSRSSYRVGSAPISRSVSRRAI